MPDIEVTVPINIKLKAAVNVDVEVDNVSQPSPSAEIFTGFTDATGVRIIPITDGLSKQAFAVAVPPIIENTTVGASILSDTQLKVEITGAHPETQKFSVLVVKNAVVTELA